MTDARAAPGAELADQTGDLTIVGADGRSIGYCEYGTPDGYPVIALHGTPGSRFKYAFMDVPAKARGLRIISLDRWGYGLTGKPASWALSAYAEDVRSVADGLGLGRFAVLGLSGGGPYAISVAHALAGRVSALGLISPVGEVASTPASSLDPIHRFCFRALPRIPGATWLVFQIFRLLSRYWPAASIAVAGARSVPADKSLHCDRAMQDGLVRAFRAGLEPGVEGTVIDLAVFSSRWDLSPGAIHVPSRLWIGTQDRSVPVAAALKLAGELPDCELSKLDQQGHFWILEHAGEVLDWLAATAQDPKTEAPKTQAPKTGEPPAVPPRPAR